MAGLARPGLSQTAGSGELRDGSTISGDPRKPRRHFRVKNPKQLTPKESRNIYDDLRKSMGSGYAFSNHPVAKAYQKWRRRAVSPFPAKATLSRVR